MKRNHARPAATVLLDNEAVQALLDAEHSKHRRALALIEAVSRLNSQRTGSAVLRVPTAVRVESGWDRTDRRAAPINRLGVRDIELSTGLTDRAARLRTDLDLSVADAHLGAALSATRGPHTIITSDVDDVARLAAHLDIPVTAIRL